VTQEEYRSHLEGQLCWHCHCPTHASHARQRQCPQCRKKWSYDRRRLEWLLAELFCQGLNAHLASRELGISYGTARIHFKKFDSALRPLNHRVAKYIISIRDEKNQVPEAWHKTGLRLIYLNLIGPGLFRKPEYDPTGDFLIVS
jgi:hypothetical protein